MPRDTLLKNQWGSVRPYTRHTAECPHRESPEQNNCRCAKWLYANRRGQSSVRRSLNTPSWAEAQRIAADTLKAFDPEIAEARKAKQKEEQEKKSVEAACKMWLASKEAEFGTGGSYPTYKSLTKKFCSWAIANEMPNIRDVTTSALTDWKVSKAWTTKSKLTQRQRWSALRQMFFFLRASKVIDVNPIEDIRAIRVSGEHWQGPYSDEQVEQLFAHIEDSINTKSPEKRRIFAARLRGMLTLLLHGGCDLIDAVHFRQDLIEQMTVEGRKVWVYSYHRIKTGVLAVVPMTDEVVQTLRNVPVMSRTPKGMPFRSFEGSDAATDVKKWSNKIRTLLRVAGVMHIEVPVRGGGNRLRPANAKQLRHTFAVNQLLSGQLPDAVARMMGHTDTQMIYKHYAPFIPKLREQHVKLVVANWVKAAQERASI